MNYYNTEKVQYINLLRALATIGVIVIHVTSPILKMTYLNNMPYWWIGNIENSAVRFSVPLFLMLSGATLLPKEYKLSEFYKKRIFRVLFPFLFWLIVYWIYRWFMLDPKLRPHQFANILSWATELFLNDGVSKHLWYVYMILFIYLFVPFIGKAVRKSNHNHLLIFLILWTLLCFFTKSMNLSFYHWKGDYFIKLLGYLQYSGFLVLGYYLNNIVFRFNKTALAAFIVYIITVTVSAVFTYSMSKNSQRLDLSIYSYFSINTIIQSAVIFILIKNIKIRNKYIIMAQNTVSDFSYGIYLVHIIIIGILFRNGIYWSFAHPLISVPLLVSLVLLGSYLIIFLIRKIPGGKYISG